MKICMIGTDFVTIAATFPYCEDALRDSFYCDNYTQRLHCVARCNVMRDCTDMTDELGCVYDAFAKTTLPTPTTIAPRTINVELGNRFYWECCVTVEDLLPSKTVLYLRERLSWNCSEVCIHL